MRKIEGPTELDMWATDAPYGQKVEYADSLACRDMARWLYKDGKVLIFQVVDREVFPRGRRLIAIRVSPRAKKAVDEIGRRAK